MYKLNGHELQSADCSHLILRADSVYLESKCRNHASMTQSILRKE